VNRAVVKDFDHVQQAIRGQKTKPSRTADATRRDAAKK